jgi:hypothetical protein
MRRIVYSTADPAGLTRAGARGRVPGAAKAVLLSYQHWDHHLPGGRAVLHNDEVISGYPRLGGYLVVLLTTSGSGSPGFHPYVHAGSEATAVVDALRAPDLPRWGKAPLNGCCSGRYPGRPRTRRATGDRSDHAGEFTITAWRRGPYDSGTQD